jgi:hypothetical protein
MGFQEWKKNQVFDARMNLDKFKSPQLSADTTQNVGSVENSVDSPGDSQDTVNIEESANSSGAEEVERPVDPDSTQSDQQAQAEKLRQLEFNLEIAQGLTIHDYFALYLKNKSKPEMAEAIKRLSPDELSELLMAYRKSLYGVPAVDSEPSKIPAQNL